MDNRIKKGLQLLIIPALAACSGGQYTLKPTLLPDKTGSQITTDPGFHTVLQQGYIEKRDKQSLFIPCQSDKPIPFEASSKFWALFHQLQKKPSEKLYAEFAGELHSASATTPYRVELKEMRYLSKPKADSCKSKPKHYAFEAEGFGEQPWTLKVQGQIIQVVTPPPNEFDFKVTSVQAQSHRHLVKFIDQLGTEGMLRFEQKACIDPNQQWIKPYQVNLRIGPTLYKGCGMAGWLSPQYPILGDWNGQYASKEGPVIYKLELQPDYSTSLSVHKPGQSAQPEQGFWKPRGAGAEIFTYSATGATSLLFDYQQGMLVSKGQTLDGKFTPFDKPLQMLKKGHPMAQHSTLPPKQAILGTRTLPVETLSATTRVDPMVHKALLKYFSDHRTKPDGNFYRYLRYDLNGDGIKELLIEMNWCRRASDGCVLLIFQGEKKGYRYISRAFDAGQEIWISEVTHHEWQDMWTQNSKGKWMLLKFNNISYNEQLKPASDHQIPEQMPVQLKFGKKSWIKLQ
ncbi:hypothetical protein [Dongshaea marina]|uniref:hypothetical protein n=1 Tax=Dongshaea marina TaxID=2047966 RepID=UPI000D3E3113|nr:hypothetical protein [Dongshaea marina]